MGRIKDLLSDLDITQDDIEMDLLGKYKDQMEYEEWLHSDGFTEYVNGEIDMTKSRYSEVDITSAIRYASEQIIIDPSEVGKEVYDMLFSEKIEEYLSLYGG
jgi:hypothetical protein